MAVLVIEDNATMREGMVQVLQKMGLEVKAAASGEAAIELLEKNPVQLVITDYRMARCDGMGVLKAVKQRWPQTEVMIITAYGSIELAVQAMQQGAADFITKPFSHEEFSLRVGKILKKLEQDEALHRLQQENVYLRHELEQEYNFGEIIGESSAMKALYHTIGKVAKTDTSVIIYGESGTGKELVARAIHKASERAQRPFIRVHSGALAEGVLESELFGHEKGSFTGALRRKHGRFELAHTGTIFLDEIGDIPLGTQVKLLRVLQEREFERVGGEQTLTVDVRVIAATHRDLKALVAEGKFREDLYYRLHIIPIYLPPLRERVEDIPLLANHFIRRISQRIGRPELCLSEEAMRMLCAYHWPGNVRELENILERAAVLAESECIKGEDLAIHAVTSEMTTVSNGILTLDRMLELTEKQAIERALRQAGGIKTKAAAILGVKTSALYYKLQKYGLL